MLTTIYVAWASGIGHANIKLRLEPIEQYDFINEYVHVDADKEKAEKVISSIVGKISPFVYHELALTALAYEEDAFDNIYRVLLLGFKFGPNVLDMSQYKDIMRNQQIRKRVRNEGCRFQEILRFHRVNNSFVAHIEPKSRIVEYLGPIFQDRMPSENFVIVDDVHSEAVVHYADQDYFMYKLTQQQLKQLLQTEELNDEYTDMWRVFYNTIAIKERENLKLQMTMFPKWARAHAVEFR